MNSRSTPSPPAPAEPPRKPAATAPKTIDSRVLLGDARSVHIDHGNQRYTLHLTRENKLILTK